MYRKSRASGEHKEVAGAKANQWYGYGKFAILSLGREGRDKLWKDSYPVYTVIMSPVTIHRWGARERWMVGEILIYPSSIPG